MSNKKTGEGSNILTGINNPGFRADKHPTKKYVVLKLDEIEDDTGETKLVFPESIDSTEIKIRLTRPRVGAEFTAWHCGENHLVMLEDGCENVVSSKAVLAVLEDAGYIKELGTLEQVNAKAAAEAPPA